MDYKIRFATPDDHDLIYALKAESVRPYVERIWGWNEDYQRKDFDSDFSHIKQFNVIEVDGSFAGFVQYYFEYPYFVEREPPAMRVRRKKFYLCVEK